MVPGWPHMCIVGSASLTLLLFFSLTDRINDSHTVPHPATHGSIHDAACLAFCLSGLSRALGDHCWTPVPLEEVGTLLYILVSLCLFDVRQILETRNNHNSFKQVIFWHLASKDSCSTFGLDTSSYRMEKSYMVVHFHFIQLLFDALSFVLHASWLSNSLRNSHGSYRSPRFDHLSQTKD